MKLLKSYYQSEPKFNSVYSKNNLPKIKDGWYVINLGEYESTETHWKALYVNGNNRRAFYQYILMFQDIPKEIEKFIGNKNTGTNVYRIQAYD